MPADVLCVTGHTHSVCTKDLIQGDGRTIHSCKRSEATYERYQERNREIALSCLENRIVQALVIPKKRIKTKPTKASKERKLKLKRIRSEIKRNRGKII